MWIVIHVYAYEDLMHYMDDAWSYEMNPVLTFYTPYSPFYLAKQVTLLHLYNKLGLLHDKSKQVFGLSLVLKYF